MRGLDLRDLLLELLALPCVTGEEGPIAELVAGLVGDAPLRRVGHSLVAGEQSGERPVVALVGHLDVVPPTDADRVPRVDGERIVGRGASDMKSGLAVAIEAFASGRWRGGWADVLLVAYAGEEGPLAGNALATVLGEFQDVAAADLAIVLEPTGNAVELGCNGALHAEATFRGTAAHSARPWLGDNALTRAAPLLAALAAAQPRDVVVDGLAYREVTTPTAAWTREQAGRDRLGGSRNVVPDAFTIDLHHRFAPDKTVSQAEATVAALARGHGAAEVVVTDAAPACPPHRDDPLVQRFLAAVDAPVLAKQGWTDVAQLAAAGVPALNFGPGVGAQAHQAGEWVPTANLAVASDALDRFLAG